MLSEWAEGLLSKMLDGFINGLDVMTTGAPAVLTNSRTHSFE